MGWINHRTVKEFTNINRDLVVMANHHDILIDVLKLMHNKHLSTIALVNDQGQLCNSISLSDIKVRTWFFVRST
jgi:predicted transcriptional regulator